MREEEPMETGRQTPPRRLSCRRPTRRAPSSCARRRARRRRPRPRRNGGDCSTRTVTRRPRTTTTTWPTTPAARAQRRPRLSRAGCAGPARSPRRTASLGATGPSCEARPSSRRRPNTPRTSSRRTTRPSGGRTSTSRLSSGATPTISRPCGIRTRPERPESACASSSSLQAVSSPHMTTRRRRRRPRATPRRRRRKRKRRATTTTTTTPRKRGRSGAARSGTRSSACPITPTWSSTKARSRRRWRRSGRSSATRRRRARRRPRSTTPSPSTTTSRPRSWRPIGGPSSPPRTPCASSSSRRLRDKKSSTRPSGIHERRVRLIRENNPQSTSQRPFLRINAVALCCRFDCHAAAMANSWGVCVVSLTKIEIGAPALSCLAPDGAEASLETRRGLAARVEFEVRVADADRARGAARRARNRRDAEVVDEVRHDADVVLAEIVGERRQVVDGARAAADGANPQRGLERVPQQPPRLDERRRSLVDPRAAQTQGGGPEDLGRRRGRDDDGVLDLGQVGREARRIHQVAEAPAHRAVGLGEREQVDDVVALDARVRRLRVPREVFVRVVDDEPRAMARAQLGNLAQPRLRHHRARRIPRIHDRHEPQWSLRGLVASSETRLERRLESVDVG
mmetsp:Transcript_13406/g.53816  ORF Transcript_13406/g.53816 Transcript_13406/m.53816 type:complete len:626 (+) Transcript_13406:395-2272(+)